jgi:translation elongation factor EF-4
MIENTVGLDPSDAVLISAKTGQGVPDVLEAIVKRIPPLRRAILTAVCRRLFSTPGSTPTAEW